MSWRIVETARGHEVRQVREVFIGLFAELSDAELFVQVKIEDKAEEVPGAPEPDAPRVAATLRALDPVAMPAVPAPAPALPPEPAPEPEPSPAPAPERAPEQGDPAAIAAKAARRPLQ